VPAAEILHERVTGSEDWRRPVALQSARPGLVEDEDDKVPEEGDMSRAISGHLEVAREMADKNCQAQVLGSLGDLLTRTSDSHRARNYHTLAQAIA